MRRRRSAHRRARAVWLVGALTLGVASASDEQPDREEALVGRIHELLATDRWVEALDESERLAEARPESRSMQGALGESLLRAGRIEEAASLLERVVRDEHPAARAALALGRIRIAEGRGDEGSALVARALEAAPDDPEVLYWAGDLASDRSRMIELLERYIATPEGRDPDRVESARGAVELARELGDRRLWVPAERPPTTEVPLTPVLGDANRVLGWGVTVELGPREKKARVLLDTGSGGLLLVERIARKSAFEPLAPQVRHGEGGSGRQESERGVIPSLRLGGLGFTDALVTATRAELDPQGRFHGLLGLSRFYGYRVTLDPRGRRLRLESGSEEFEGQRYWMLSGQMLVRAEVPGAGFGLFVVATGASTTVLARSLVERAKELGAGEEMTLRAVGGDVAGARAVRGIEVRFAGARTGEDPLGVVDFSVRSRVGGVEVSGLIGRDLLDGGTLVIDTVARRLRLEGSR